VGRGMRRLCRWAREHDTSITAFTVEDAKAYRQYLAELLLAQSSIASLLYAGSALCDELMKRNERIDNPFASMKKTKTVASIPRSMLKEAEWARVLDNLSRFGEEKDFRKKQDIYRAHVIAELLYGSGMRIGEAALLCAGDIDVASGTVCIREGKGGRERTAFLSDFSCAVLSLFLPLRPMVIHEGFGHREKLFGMSEGNLSHFMSVHLAAACRKENLSPVTSHGIRHMTGWHLLRSGAPLRAIQGILGHLQMRSTEIYTRVDKETLRLVLDTHHPRSLSLCADEKDSDETLRRMECI
jgi:site-specific recombinase XerD